MNENKVFYNYILSEEKSLDVYYFTRKFNSTNLKKEFQFFDDPNFRSSYDTILATLYAYEK